MEKIYCDDVDERHICDKIAIGRYNNNHLKSQTHINTFRKRQQLLQHHLELQTMLWILKKLFLSTKVKKRNPVNLKFLISIFFYKVIRPEVE